ncbi:hypothetical protein FNV43_RR21166 [Rhamnella rubrinervis]|uniref:Uncharacterized protein n=1 Tax=Rhamnella rubrinervis TaxID=2594499 RepID=A0A8K0E262_9ROSA|nr:hypothetical protein FNV43_RR21166 [Rhamnella rubrinervis]
MHCALQTTNSDTPKISDRGSSSLSKKFQEQNNLKTLTENRGVSSLSGRNSDRRCSVVTFLTLHPDGNWRIVALPLHRPDQPGHLRSAAQVNMDSLQLVCPPPINTFKANRRKLTKGPIHGGSYCVKSFTNRRVPGSTVRHHSRNKSLVNKTTKWNELPQKDCQKSLSFCEPSCLVPNGSSAINSTEMFIDSSKVDNVIKRNSKKKSRNKGKSAKKYLCDTGTEPEVSEEYAHGSLNCETCHNNDVDHGDGKLLSSTALKVSLSNGGVGNSETPKTCTCYSDKVDIPRVTVPCVIQKSSEKHSLCNLENQIHSAETAISVCVGVEDTHHSDVSGYGDVYAKGYCDTHDSCALETISSGSYSENVTDFGHDSTQSEKENCTNDGLEPQCPNAREAYFSSQSLLNDADALAQTERMSHVNQGCSINDMQVVIPAKRNKQTKTVPRISGVSRAASVGNFHGRSGKENNHSVWQKVQRSNANDNIGEPKKFPVPCQSDITAKEAPDLKRTCNAVEHKRQSKDKHSQKVKRKNGPASKEEYNCYSRKGNHGHTTNSDGCAKFNILQNGTPDVSSPVSDQNVLNIVSRSLSETSFPISGFQSSRVEHVTTESAHIMHVHPNEMEPLESACNTSTNCQNIENWDSSSPESCDSLNQSNLVQVQPPVFLPHLFFSNSVRQGQKEISLTEYGKQTHSSGSVMQKWIPRGLKDPSLTSSDESSSLEHFGDSAAESWTYKSTSETEISFVPAAEVSCMCQSSGEVTCSLHNKEHRLPKLRYEDASLLKEDDNTHDADHHRYLSNKSIDLNPFESDSKRIAQAVSDACRLQLASEAVQMATGDPIAEIERLLHNTSPVIYSSTTDLISCHTCSRDPVPGMPLCRHETPDISLGSIWQWYEKHGNYGLEIKAEDYDNSKKLGADRSSFCAYFVPFLSAIQLFRKCKNYSGDTSDGVSCSEVLDTVGVAETSEKSTTGHRSIYSLLFPKPKKEFESIPPLANQVCNSELSSGSAELQMVEKTFSSDVELVFEYFESEQPQQRQPLYEKIKELVRGEGPLLYNVYGDPTNLDSIKLNDLHPRTWYSVAWYPIYRIPEGNFRAAFLTYHSLGHLVRSTASSDSQSSQSIVSPAVGLQSYNAQGECWFQPRHSRTNLTTGTPDLNPRGILEERLRTLEATASLMARAVVSKGDQKSANRHPDYEFFLSRRRL